MNTMLSKLAGFATVAVIMIMPVMANTAQASEGDLTPATPAVCDARNVPAAATYTAIAEMPPLAKTMALTGQTLVQVNIDPTGAILDTIVAKSSGTPLLDRAALAAAQASSFHPEIRDCTPVAGSYLFVVDFSE